MTANACRRRIEALCARFARPSSAPVDQQPAIANIWRWPVRFALSGVAIAAILAVVDVSDVRARLATTPFWVVAAVFVMILLQSLACAVRWYWINHAAALEISVGTTMKALFAGLLYNQILPSGMGGDVIRVIRIAEAGSSWSAAFGSVATDRLVGLLALLASAAAGLHSLGQADMPDLIKAMVALGALASVILFALLIFRCGAAPRCLAAHSARARLQPWLKAVYGTRVRALRIIGLSIAIHLWTIAIFALMAHAMNTPVSAAALAVVLPAAFLLAAAPVSFGGWGVREGAVAVGLAAYGVPADAAVGMSILFGLAQSAVATLGTPWAWSLHGWRRRKSAGAHRQTRR